MKVLGRIILFFGLLTALLIFSIAAQAQNTMPFTATAQVTGNVEVPTTVAVPTTTTVKVPGLGAVREGVAELQDRFGTFEDKFDEQYHRLGLLQSKVDGLVARPTPGVGIPDWWWVFMVLAVVMALILLAFNRRQVTVNNNPTQTCNCGQGGGGQGGSGGSGGDAKQPAGGDTPMAQIPPIPGTSYRIDHAPLPEVTRRNIDELVVSQETGEAIERIIRAIGEITRKPEPPKPGSGEGGAEVKVS